MRLLKVSKSSGLPCDATSVADTAANAAPAATTTDRTRSDISSSRLFCDYDQARECPMLAEGWRHGDAHWALRRPAGPFARPEWRCRIGWDNRPAARPTAMAVAGTKLRKGGL